MNNTIINKKDLVKPDDPRDYKYFINQISESEIETFRKQILSGNVLPDIHFSYESSAKTLVRIVLLSRVMTIKEIENWYRQCCWDYFLEQPVEERYPVYRKKYNKKIFGEKGIHRFKKIDREVLTVIKTLKEVYFIFKNQAGFDSSLIRQLKTTISELKPLKEVKIRFDNQYKFKPGFLTFLDSQIDNEISQTEMENYFKSMALKLEQELNMGQELYLSIADLENYIFGKRVNLRPGMFYSRQNKPVKLVRSFYHSVFPCITKSLQSIKHRESIYQFCNLSDEERRNWEKVYQQNCYRKESEVLNLNDNKSNLSIFQFNQKEVSLLQECLNKLAPRYQISRTVPEIREIKELLKEEPALKELIKETIYNNSLKRKELNEILASWIKEIKKYLFETQFEEEFDLSRDIWKVYRKTRNGYFYHTLDFTSVKNQKLREDLKIIALEDIRISQGKDRFADRMPVIIKIISELEEKYQIKSFSDLVREHLIALFHHYRLRENKSVSTLTKYNQFLKFAFETLASNKKEYKSLKNLPELIRFSTKSSSIKTKDIPIPVIESLLDSLDALPNQIALMLELFFESGWRYKEIAELNPSSFVEDQENPEFVKMTGILSKTRLSHQRNGMGERISCFITRELYEKIKNFIEDTKAERKNYNIQTLFYSINNGQVTTIANSKFNYEINALIRRHNICDSKGGLWAFSTRQTRTTVATDLINSGASITSVQKQLNHASPDTTAAYYARPDRHQTALINLDYYNQSIGEQEEKKDTLFEKINLYEYEQNKSFKMNFGRCSRPEGPCGRGLQNQCISCPKLLVSRDSLSHWKKLLSEAQRELSLYEECCRRMGIDLSELEYFSEYLSLKELCHSYESLIRKAGGKDA